MRKLKLIWDFRGPDSEKIAEHHEKHLMEYVKLNALNSISCGKEIVSQMHALAFMIVDENQMPPIRDSLKPHRGQLYTETKN